MYADADISKSMNLIYFAQVMYVFPLNGITRAVRGDFSCTVYLN